MATTAVIIDSDGRVAIIVHPDRESQLDDPAFNPKGCVQVRMARADYDALKFTLDDVTPEPLALLRAAGPLVAEKDSGIAVKIAARISEAEAKITEKKEQARLAQEEYEKYLADVEAGLIEPEKEDAL